MEFGWDSPRQLARSLYRSGSKVRMSEGVAVSTCDPDLEAFLDETEAKGGDGESPYSSYSTSFSPSSAPSRPKSKYDKNDGRMFPDLPLYCEGEPKPALRGVLHFLCAMCMPWLLHVLYKESEGSVAGRMSSMIYILAHINCYGASGLFHVGTWSPKTEIFLQKLDHAGITILSFACFLPAIFLVMPAKPGMTFLLLLTATAGKSISGIYASRAKRLLLWQVLVPASSVLFVYWFVQVFTPLELVLYFCTVLFKMTGTAVFVRRSPDPWPQVFGYHEIFHCLVVAAGSCIFICNYSIVHRICNPYSHYIDVGEQLHGKLLDATTAWATGGTD